MSDFGVSAPDTAPVQPAVPVPTIPEGKLLSPGAVAKLFGVDPRTVTRWVDKGLLTPILTPGGHRRYRYLDIMALRDSLQQRGSEPGERPATPPSPSSPAY
ncbi:MAG: helix-turn-helix domain-containing protein [Actinomycetales bacterium]|nr:helix-turn-helix domain-containing protein [Actinomycetales bacterium]